MQQLYKVGQCKVEVKRLTRLLPRRGTQSKRKRMKSSCFVLQ